MMTVVATTPETNLGSVLGLIGSRRGIVIDVEEHHGVNQVHASVPLAELFGFTGDLRSVSQGRASATITLSTYQPVAG